MVERQAIWKDYKLHIMVLIVTVIAELIGSQSIRLGRFSFTLAPLIFSMLMMTIFYLIPQQKIITEKNAGNAAQMMALAGGLLIAKLGVSSGAAIEEVLSAGIAVTLQNLGEGFSFVFALPLAMAFGMQREAVGMTFGVSREANVALISEKYGAESAEFRGVMTNYIVGTIFGVVAVSFLMSVLAEIQFISPISLSLATGIGSASMMVGGLGTLIDRFPEMATELEAYAAISNLVSSVINIYTALFIGLPLTERAYNWMDNIRTKRGAQK
ncbi:DUF3100 domain-containing protein [Fundicoccus culcitae]|uniref:DUF3100 domain-containing protein n=1 Tax=Fundicoccus culcitae TaxID=2969821 RepID=A0ABY5P285_9LACT|nr:DUF3100 domain-containing protein [Fundicoccus culcitae]UUX32826.1 DUF3100 domain-containing protein [Fundicoccus culcitae]